MEVNGKIFHSLKIISNCGGGAYGDVYFCEDISGRKLAVKIVSKQKLGEAWQRELKGVINYRKITENAPDLLQIFHVEEDEETFFYTMEAADSASDAKYVPDTLAGRLKNGPLPQSAIFNVLSGIFSGIKKIHDAGFAHRDIKPDNILFVRGVPKLGDIGLLSALNATFTQIAGTMEFIPPEVRVAESGDSSDRLSRQRNDLYAFGKVIYCVITGCDPQFWPAVPKELPLSLPFKFFLRLSFQLCDKDPVRRLDSMDELQKEFVEIERKLLYGENLRDKLAYQIKRCRRGICSGVIHVGNFLRRFWGAVLIVLLLGAGGAWYGWLKPEFDITHQKTRIYRSQTGFVLTLPRQWEILENKTIQKKLAEFEAEKDKNLSPLEAKRMNFLIPLMKLGADYIYCDFDEKFSDNIVVQTIPIPGTELTEQSDGELRVDVKKLFQGELNFQTEIYEIKRLKISGIPCIFIDLSHDPQKIRIHNYIFALKDKCVTIALTAKKSTFKERQEQFSRIIKTIKFIKK